MTEKVDIDRSDITKQKLKLMLREQCISETQMINRHVAFKQYVLTSLNRFLTKKGIKVFMEERVSEWRILSSYAVPSWLSFKGRAREIVKAHRRLKNGKPVITLRRGSEILVGAKFGIVRHQALFNKYVGAIQVKKSQFCMKLKTSRQEAPICNDLVHMRINEASVVTLKNRLKQYHGRLVRDIREALGYYDGFSIKQVSYDNVRIVQSCTKLDWPDRHYSFCKIYLSRCYDAPRAVNGNLTLGARPIKDRRNMPSISKAIKIWEATVATCLASGKLGKTRCGYITSDGNLAVFSSTIKKSVDRFIKAYKATTRKTRIESIFSRLERKIEKLSDFEYRKTNGVMVTLEDSTNAGNCQGGTDNFASSNFPNRTEVSLYEIFQLPKEKINGNVLRACCYAVARAKNDATQVDIERP